MNSLRALAAPLLSVVVLALPPGAAPPAGAVEPTPIIRTIAGGLPAEAVATQVSIRPAGIAYAADGTLYAADPAAGTVWAITPDGSAGVIAGDGRSCRLRSGAAARACITDQEITPATPATEIHLGRPVAVAPAPGGGVYVADVGDHTIHRYDPASRTLQHVAGNGTTSYDPADEGLPAIAVGLSNAAQLAVDSAGGVYVADLGHRLVRRIDAQGRIRTVAGCATDCTVSIRDRSPLDRSTLPAQFTFAIDAAGQLAIATPTAVYRADLARGQWRRVSGDTFAAGTTPEQGEGGPAVQARYGDISGLVFDAEGGLVILDRAWSRLRRIDPPGDGAAVVRHLAGHPAGFDSDGRLPTQTLLTLAGGDAVERATLAAHPAGGVAVSELDRNRIRAVPSAGAVETLAGNGAAAPATRVHIDNDFQPDQVNGGFSKDGGAAAQAQLFGPFDVAAADGTVYVLDRHANRVRAVRPDGTITTVAGSGCAGRGCDPRAVPVGDGGPATAAGLLGPSAIALAPGGSQLYVADYGHDRLRQVNLSDAPVTVFPEAAAPITIAPGAIATVAGNGSNCVNVTFYCGDGQPATSATFSDLTGVAVAADGTLYLSDSGQQGVRRIDGRTGGIQTIVGGLFHSECEGRGVEGLPGRATLLCGPTDLALGPDGALYVAETGDYGFGSGYVGHNSAPRIRRVELTSGAFTSTVVAGTGLPGNGGDGGPARAASFAFPRGLAFAPDGSLYVADSGNSRIRRIAADGTITTVAGSGSWLNAELHGCGAPADGGPATAAGLCAPMGVAVGPDGTVYVADQINNRVRAFDG